MGCRRQASRVLDIYATSIDYDPSLEASQEFFKTVQNKMHWAAHGQTAAEVVHTRVDATQPNMGLTNWSGAKIRKANISIAKNFLQQDEIEALNRIVTAYLEFRLSVWTRAVVGCLCPVRFLKPSPET